MIRFLPEQKIYFSWMGEVSKKLYNEIEKDIEDGDIQDIYIKVFDNLFCKVLVQSDGKSVRVCDERSPMNGLSVAGKVNVYGSIVGKFEEIV